MWSSATGVGAESRDDAGYDWDVPEVDQVVVNEDLTRRKTLLITFFTFFIFLEVRVTEKMSTVLPGHSLVVDFGPNTTQWDLQLR
jgi:hypothetical protein